MTRYYSTTLLYNLKSTAFIFIFEKFEGHGIFAGCRCFIWLQKWGDWTWFLPIQGRDRWFSHTAFSVLQIIFSISFLNIILYFNILGKFPSSCAIQVWKARDAFCIHLINDTFIVLISDEHGCVVLLLEL